MILSIIIVNYNVSDYLRQCLKSVYNSKGIDNFEVIVVDNFSHDNSVEMVKSEYPNVNIIRNNKNYGFAKGINIGINNSNGKYLCFLNPDTLISENTFSTLIKFMQINKNVGCVGPKILNSDGTLQLACKRSFPSPLVALSKLLGLSTIFPKSKIFGKYNLTYLNENKIHNVDAISGSFMLLTRDIVDKVGYLDEIFFMFGEDLDYCHRIKQAGYQIIYNPNAQAIHYKGESVKQAPYDMIKIFYKAIGQFFKKHKKDFISWRIIQAFVFAGIYFRKMISYYNSYTSKILTKILDIAFIMISFVLAIFLWYFFNYNESLTLEQVYKHMPLIMDFIICWIIISFWFNLYKNDYLSYGKAIVVSNVTFILSSTTTYFINTIAFSRGVLLLAFIFTTFFSSIWRITIHILYKLRKINFKKNNNIFTRRAIIFGINNESLRIGEMLNKDPKINFNFIGYTDTKNINNNPYFLGRISDIKGIIKNHNINEILIPEDYFKIAKLIKMIDKISSFNVNYKLVPKGKKMLIGKGIVENISGIPLVDLEMPLFDKSHLITKRIFDIILSLIIIILTLPFHLYFTVLGKYEELYIWTKNNMILKIYNYKSDYNILKSLPLMYSILNGNISFVGSKIINTSFLNPNLIIKPGITGIWYIKSNKDLKSYTTFEHYYAQNYSLSYDIEIILKTLFRI